LDQHEAATQDIERISLKTVDHALWRVTQLVAAAGAVLLVAVIALLFLVRRIFLP